MPSLPTRAGETDTPPDSRKSLLALKKKEKRKKERERVSKYKTRENLSNEMVKTPPEDVVLGSGLALSPVTLKEDALYTVPLSSLRPESGPHSGFKSWLSVLSTDYPTRELWRDPRLFCPPGRTVPTPRTGCGPSPLSPESLCGKNPSHCGKPLPAPRPPSKATFLW